MHLKKNKVAFVDLSYQKGGTQKTFLYHILNFKKLQGYIYARERSIFKYYEEEILDRKFKLVLTSNDAPFERAVKIGKLKILKPSGLYLHLSLLHFLTKHFMPDINILVGSALFSNVYAYILSKLKGIGFIAHLNDVDLISSKRLFILEQAKMIIVISEFQKNELIDKGIKNRNIHVVYPPLPHMPHILYRDPKSTPTIGFVGRLSPEKGIHIFLNLLEERHDLRGVIAGDLKREPLDFYNKISARIKTLEQSGRLDYMGFVNDISDVLRKINILIYPSIVKEGFGRTILESLLAGIPVIGSNMGAIPEVLNGIPYTEIVSPTLYEFNNAIDTLLSQKIKPLDIRKAVLKQFPLEKSSGKLERLLMEYTT